MAKTEFEIILGDITKIDADAIVNAANTSLLGGSGVDGAIHKAAGSELLKECRKLNGCKTGEAKITNAYKLPAKYIIHTPGPVWNGGNKNEEIFLESCYKNCLKLALEYKCRTIAFPSISTGIYHFPLDKAADIVIKTIYGFISNNDFIQKIQMVCFDEITKGHYDNAKDKYLKNLK